MRRVGVSRITVHAALFALEREGLILRRRGRGAFVVENLPRLKLPKLTDSVDDLIARGMKVRIDVRDFRFTTVAKNITDKLGLRRGSEVIRIERLRFAKASSRAYILNYLPRKLGRKSSVTTFWLSLC
jgi:GntR family transcriptional regulator